MADQSKNQQYDLTKKLSQYLDRHLIFPLLDFLSAREIWPAGQLTDAKLALLSKTNMIDYYAEIYKNAKGQDIPQVCDPVTLCCVMVLHLPSLWMFSAVRYFLVSFPPFVFE